jgi:hypothetical protein
VKPALVTGATGFVGWHVARALLDRGQAVRVLARNPSALRELEGGEAVQGDLRDPASLQRAVAGCSTVYHVAADYRLWTSDPQEMHRSNVDGTRAMLDGARRAGVERFVYTSTVGCIAFPEGSIGDESMVAQPADMQGRSLFPLFRGEAPADWRESFYFHYYEYPRWHRVRPHYGVVTDRYKLVHYYKPDVDDWELYDLKENPDETQNFINDPKYAETIGKLKNELAQLRAELKVPPASEEPRAAYGKAPFDDPATMPFRKVGGKDKPEPK